MKIADFKSRVPSTLYFKYKQKLDFYELTNSDIIIFLITKFLNGDFDDELNLPK